MAFDEQKGSNWLQQVGVLQRGASQRWVCRGCRGQGAKKWLLCTRVLQCGVKWVSFPAEEKEVAGTGQRKPQGYHEV